MISARHLGQAARCAMAASLIMTLSGSSSAETLRRGLVIDRVTVVDVRTGRLARNRAIIIADGNVVKIVPAGSIVLAGSAQRIDGKSRFVVPGFNDMHAHNLNAESSDTSLPLMLANGITGFRQMAGAEQLLAARMSKKLMFPPNSPALLAMPGAILSGPRFAAPDAVVAEIIRQKAQGADFIKVVDLPLGSFIAAADAAQANGLPFVGHLPPVVSEREAIRHGMLSIEHLGPGISLLINCSRDEVQIRSVLAASAKGGEPNFDASPERVRRMLVNPMMMTPPPGLGLISRVLASYDEVKCKSFAKEVAASKTWLVPTLVRLEAMELGNSAALRDNPDLRFVPSASRKLWREVGAEFDNRFSADQRRVLANLFEAQAALARALDAAGAKMLAGTDFGGGWIVPGYSLHREFDLLARAGIQPLHVLQMTTLNPALFLGREQRMGTVAPGRKADLVLLDGDPTESVANMHKISAVVREGRYLDRAALDAIIARAAKALD